MECVNKAPPMREELSRILKTHLGPLRLAIFSNGFSVGAAVGRGNTNLNKTKK
jgi:hypothetical protein